MLFPKLPGLKRIGGRILEIFRFKVSLLNAWERGDFKNINLRGRMVVGASKTKNHARDLFFP